MKQQKVKIELTKDQQDWLLRRLKLDWDEEINYQYGNEVDDTYLEDLYGCYIALLGEPKGLIDALVNNEIARNMRQDIEELKEFKEQHNG